MVARAISSSHPAPTWLWFGSTTVGMYPRATPIWLGTVAAMTTEAARMPIRRTGRDGSGGRPADDAAGPPDGHPGRLGGQRSDGARPDRGGPRVHPDGGGAEPEPRGSRMA